MIPGRLSPGASGWQATKRYGYVARIPSTLVDGIVRLGCLRSARRFLCLAASRRRLPPTTQRQRHGRGSLRRRARGAATNSCLATIRTAERNARGARLPHSTGLKDPSRRVVRRSGAGRKTHQREAPQPTHHARHCQDGSDSHHPDHWQAGLRQSRSGRTRPTRAPIGLRLNVGTNPDHRPPGWKRNLRTAKKLRHPHLPAQAICRIP